MEANAPTQRTTRDPAHQLSERIARHKTISDRLSCLSDQNLIELLDKATPRGKGIGGTALNLLVCDSPVFVKKVRLTDRERQPENTMSTANLFDLPTYYQYGIGSAGFDLSEPESRFFQEHRNFDIYSAATNLARRLVSTLFPQESCDSILHEFAGGRIARTVDSELAAVLTKYAPVAVIMSDFVRSLEKETRRTAYPKQELERAAAGFPD